MSSLNQSEVTLYHSAVFQINESCSPKGLATAAVIGAFLLLQVTVPWAEASIYTRTFLYMSIGLTMHLSNAPARKVLQCAILRSNYGRAGSLFQPRVWFFGTLALLLFLSHSYWQSQMYGLSVLNRQEANKLKRQ